MHFQTDTLLLALVALQIKHFICDFTLQSYRTMQKKGVYLHRVGLVHAGEHALGSIPALWILSLAPSKILILIGAEFLAHYHVDWSKAQIDKRFGLTFDRAAYWAVFGADQMAHQLTYIAMIFGAQFLA